MMPKFKDSLMAITNPELIADPRYQAMMRKPQRITITLPWSVYQALIEESTRQGRSMSNLACFWMERYYSSHSRRGA